jgi:hypothetical protein
VLVEITLNMEWVEPPMVVVDNSIGLAAWVIWHSVVIPVTFLVVAEEVVGLVVEAAVAVAMAAVG